jgi:SAM-dependent methyltransferase
MNTVSTQTGGSPAFKIIVKTEREVAYESPDHLVPWGTRRDNSVNQRFNDKLYKLFPMGRFLKVLDLGCSGGGFVRNCFDDGHLAIGLEGSDFSKRLGRAEWRTIPEYLFTGDVTRDIEIFTESKGQLEPLLFDVVTSWEMMEHIATPDIPRVAANVKKHLAPGGLWIMSVSPREDIVNGVNLHQTVQPQPWWVAKFAQLGLENLPEYVNYFNTQWVRGPKYGYSNSFHLVLAQGRANLPPVPREGLLRWIYDRWLNSMPQKFIAGRF